jgi:glyoxylase-like metal-dependent hydrolase (beta-lactamase superfamily II)
MTQADYDFWTDEGKLSHPQIGQFVAATRAPTQNRDRIVFIKDGQDVIAGIQAIATPGHTVGHVSFMVTSQGHSILNMGDVVHHHIISVETPRRQFSYDTDGKLGVETRLRLFDMLAGRRIPFIAYFPVARHRHVGRHGDAYPFPVARVRCCKLPHSSLPGRGPMIGTAQDSKASRRTR